MTETLMILFGWLRHASPTLRWVHEATGLWLDELLLCGVLLLIWGWLSLVTWTLVRQRGSGPAARSRWVRTRWLPSPVPVRPVTLDSTPRTLTSTPLVAHDEISRQLAGH